MATPAADAQAASAATGPPLYEETDTLQFRDGKTPNLHVVYWTRTGPMSKPGANILLWIHGIGEHSGRYKPFAARLLANVPQLDGIASYDQRGHGKSGGTRGLATGVDELVEDFVERVSPRLALQFGTEARIVLGGHSLGGLVCAGAAARPDWLAADACGTVEGVVLSGPAVSIVVEGTMNKMLAPVAGVFSWIPGVKRFTKTTGIENESLSHDEEQVKAYVDDEMVHDAIGLGLAADMLTYGRRLCERVKAAEGGELLIKGKPVVVLHGEEDRVCMLEGSRALVEAAGPQVKLEVVTGSYHEMHNEKEECGRKAFFDIVCAFLTGVYSQA